MKEITIRGKIMDVEDMTGRKKDGGRKEKHTITIEEAATETKIKITRGTPFTDLKHGQEVKVKIVEDAQKTIEEAGS